KSCGVAFVNCDLQITRAVEECEFFSLGHICIGFADAVDDFVAFEYDAKAASLSLFHELFSCDIDDHILEIIDEDDLSFDPVVVQQRSKVIALEIARIRLADGCQRFTIYDLVDASSHDGGAMYRVSRSAFTEGNAYNNLWRLFE